MQCALTTELQAILRGIVNIIRHASEIVQLGARLEVFRNSRRNLLSI
jgi:hypothetical protein